MEHRLFFLTSGERPPDDGYCTGHLLEVLPENKTGLIWIGPNGSWSRDDLENRVMTAQEIAEHEKNAVVIPGAKVNVSGKEFTIIERNNDKCLVADTSLNPSPVYLVDFNSINII